MPIASGALGKPNSYYNQPERNRFKGDRNIPQDDLKKRNSDAQTKSKQATTSSGSKGKKEGWNKGGKNKGNKSKDGKKGKGKSIFSFFSRSRSSKVTTITVTSTSGATTAAAVGGGGATGEGLSEEEKKKRRRRCCLWILLALLLLLLLAAIIIGILAAVGIIPGGQSNDNPVAVNLTGTGVDRATYDTISSSCKGQWKVHFLAYNASEPVINSTAAPPTPSADGTDFVCCYNFTDSPYYNMSIEERPLIIEKGNCTHNGDCEDLTIEGEFYPCISVASVLSNSIVVMIFACLLSYLCLI
ncbi:uncharacterized protein LOC106172313 [Lingula anatina]|uniref:Uncharacterized protein LOC106172313 n=1 Tax=Lingula anatina TaxID=7574 RepID=A0A1S3JDK6_LINAN|nr:uncharacterized protein LOC106172313 [Lingula anatina]|eukprot:XP_013408413.1 uncharacterized protein LOC106172313 [Lingula anatina]